MSTPGRRAMDVALAVLVLAVVSFAPLARYAADRLPLVPGSREFLALDDERVDGGSSLPVQDLPAGLPGDASVSSPADVLPLAVPALGRSGAVELLTILGASDFADRLTESAIRGDDGASYPYRYPVMTRFLDAAPEGGRTREAAGLGAALVALSTRTGADTVANAPAAAYAVLDRARATGECGAQLDLLLLVAADAQPRDDVVATEARRAETVCPGDPTPAWLHGQYLSQRATTEHDGPGDPVPVDAQERADDLFEGLLVEFPQAVGVLAGWADNRLRVAVRTAAAQPFTARHAFEEAGAGYRRAGIPSDGDDYLPGRARALLGLGEAAAAAELMADAAGAQFPGVHLQVLLHAQEDAHEFAAASATARRLHEAGLAAFADDGPAYPVPGNAAPEGRGPLGTDRYTPLSAIDLQPAPEAGGNGALVVDASYVPVFREEDGITGTVVDCPDWAWRRDAVLAGAPAAALEDLPSGLFEWFEGIRPDDNCPFNASFVDLVRAEAGQPEDVTVLRGGPQDPEVQAANFLGDSRQNLWRWAGDLDRAEDVIGEWAARVGDDDPLPVQRLAEVRFLQREYHEAARLFGSAARLYRDRQWDDDLDVWETLLQRGGALLRAGRAAEARPLLRTLEERAAQGAAYQRSLEHEDASARFAMVAFHARALLADSERDTGALHAAVEDYQAARELVPSLLEAGATGFRPERVDNNLAVTLAALDRGDDALRSAQRAIAADPKSPVFLLTAGVAADRAGDTGGAIQHYREALASDPGTFPAANDLGVLLASEGREDDAAEALRGAVGVAPDYALGWFNLGVVEAERGPTHLLSAQGALAHAYELDPTLADREPTPTADETTYRTRLDLSRPLPPRWSFARLQQVSPATSASLLAVLLLGVGLIRSAGRGRGSDLASQFLEPVSERLGRIRLLAHVRRPLWAVLVTVVVFTIPALRNPVIGVTPLLAGALGVLVVAMAGLRMRTVRARSLDIQAAQESWVPGMAFGLATGSLGAPWAPLPVVRTLATPLAGVDEHDAASTVPGRASADRTAARVHAAAPITLGTLAVILFLETAWLGVPLTRAWAVAALIMTASTLLPVEPLDGARLSKGGVIGSVGVLAGALLVVLGVV
jgi:tetratricopeptide (TPR) repeat protein